MGTKFVYKPDLDGPIFSTPFIKKSVPEKMGNITITPKIIIPLTQVKLNYLCMSHKITQVKIPKKAT